jgi:hypothetical protein
MKLNIYNNFRAIYYNTLANFYLCFNSFVPYYDDVIISLSITSFKNIINNNLNLKSIKQNRMIQLLYSLNDKDKLIVDDDGYIIIYYDKDDKICAADAADAADAEERAATEEDDEADAEERVATEEDDEAEEDAEVSPSNPEVSPSNPEVSPSNPEVSPSNPEVSPSNPDVSPSNPDVSPSNPDVSPSNPEEAADVAFETEEVNEHYNSLDKKNN